MARRRFELIERAILVPPPQPSPSERAFTPVFDGYAGEGAHRPRGARWLQLSRKLRSLRDRDGCLSLRSAFASI